jgi:anti-sigma regulatory factor (Ser/Thr protein kinase)
VQVERQSFRAREEDLGTLLTAAAATAERLGLAREVRLKLALVLEELFLNTVHYGVHETTDPHVYLSLYATPQSVRLIYEDEGIPYNPLTTVDRAVLHEGGAQRRVGGLGVLLVEGLAATSRYARVGDCNRIELSFAAGQPVP